MKGSLEVFCSFSAALLSLAYFRVERGSWCMRLFQLMILVGGLGRKVEGVICGREKDFKGGWSEGPGPPLSK